MEYSKQNFITELKQMNFEELCGMANINIDDAKRNNFSCDVIVSFISSMLG